MGNIKKFYKKFKRSSDNRIFAGVCGGLAEYFGIDSRLVRTIFLVCTLLNGVTIILYAAMWMVFPVGTIENHDVNENKSSD